MLLGISPSIVLAVWQREGLILRIHRLLWLEEKTAGRGGLLTEHEMRLLNLHRLRTVDPEHHVEVPKPGNLLCQDTYFVGTIKGVGKISTQSVVDAHYSLAFGQTGSIEGAHDSQGGVVREGLHARIGTGC